MNKFDACMKEAQKLVTMTFCPALDALKRDDVASILDAVIMEADLVKEGHTDFPRMGVRRKLEQVARFVEKWAAAAVECEDEGYCIDFLREMGREVSALVDRRAEIEAAHEQAKQEG
jgi:hypothetical protein